MEKRIFCNHCKRFVPKTNDERCDNCGTLHWGYNEPVDNHVMTNVSSNTSNDFNKKNNSNTAKIFCNHCKRFVPKTNDKKCANCGTLNWGINELGNQANNLNYYPGHTASIATTTVPGYIPNATIKKNKTHFVHIVAIGIFLLIAIPVSYYFIQSNANNDIFKKVSPNIFLFENKFVYIAQLQFSNGSTKNMEIVKLPDNKFDLYNAESSNNNIVFANAVVVDKDGKCFTSQHATEPWDDPIDQKNLRHLLTEELEEEQVVSINISGRSIYMGIIPWDDSLYGNKDTMIECEQENTTEAYIKRKNRQNSLPVNMIELAGQNDDKKLIIFSLPQSIINESPNNTNQPPVNKEIVGLEGVMDGTNSMNLLIDGSPIFNKKGELVAIFNAQTMMADKINK